MLYGFVCDEIEKDYDKQNKRYIHPHNEPLPVNIFLLCLHLLHKGRGIEDCRIQIQKNNNII